MPKRTVLDPQGMVVKNAIKELGFAGVQHVRVGKFLELEFAHQPEKFRLETLCRDLLSNPVIEDFVIQSEADASGSE